MKWAYFAETVNRLIRPLTTIIIARFLLPEDYGLVALIAIMTSTASLIWSMGLPTALIQRKTDVEAAANATFWINSALALLAFMVLNIGAPIWANIFNEPRLIALIPLLSIPLLLDGVSMVHNAMLQKRMEFSRLFWRSTLPSLVPLLITLPLAIGGNGYWALAWGIVMGSIVSNASLWLLSSWRPSFTLNRVVTWEMIRFGVKTLGEAVQNWIENYTDRLVIGLFMAVEILGVYSLGIALFSMLFEYAFGPVKSVSYAWLCRVSDNLDEQRRIFHRGNQLVMFLVFPMGVGIVCIAQDISEIVFADKYPGLDRVLIIMSLFYVAKFSQVLVAPLFRAAGRPDLNLRINLITATLVIILYPLFGRYGLHVFMLVEGFVPLIMLVVSARLVSSLLKVPGWFLLQPALPPIGAAFSMFVILEAVNALLLSSGGGLLGWLFMIAKVILGIGVYLGTLRLLSKESFLQALYLAKLFRR